MSDIMVTKPHMPPLEKFTPFLEKMWSSRNLSNDGPFHQQFEQAVSDRLGIEHVTLVNNGTSALVIAIQALGICDAEIITTPFSFVATSNAIVWTKNNPVFVDVEPDGVNIDPNKIEAAITPKTRAILATHCYGHPCDNEALSNIAEQYDLKLIYDAAHAFGVEGPSGSILQWGNASIASFHATKVFHTFEGGAIFTKDEAVKSSSDALKNFGMTGKDDIDQIGINAKMNEFCSAFGLLQLEHFHEALFERQRVDQQYREQLEGVEGLTCLQSPATFNYNYSYFPIKIDEPYGVDRDELWERLKSQGIFARRYFYPLISNLSAFAPYQRRGYELKSANKLANSILCLPIYPDLTSEDIDRICEVIRK